MKRRIARSVVLDPLHLGRAARRRQRRGDDRELMHIQRDPQTHIRGRGRANVRHGLVLQSRMRLWPKRPSTPQKSTRDRCERARASPDGVHAD